MTHARTAPHRPRRRTRSTLAIAALIAVAAAGCGSGSEREVVNGTSTTRPATTTEAPTLGSRAGSAVTTQDPAHPITSSSTTTTAEPPATLAPPETTSTPNAEVATTVDAPSVTWALAATAFRGEDYVRVAFACPGAGEPGPVWGTVTYTDDSSVCTAAVHAGLIGFDGGRVVIEIRPGLDTYEGADANGVTSEPYESWAGSFVFPGT